MFSRKSKQWLLQHSKLRRHYLAKCPKSAQKHWVEGIYPCNRLSRNSLNRIPHEQYQSAKISKMSTLSNEELKPGQMGSRMGGFGFFGFNFGSKSAGGSLFSLCQARVCPLLRARAPEQRTTAGSDRIEALGTGTWQLDNKMNQSAMHEPVSNASNVKNPPSYKSMSRETSTNLQVLNWEAVIVPPLETDGDRRVSTPHCVCPPFYGTLKQPLPRLMFSANQHPFCDNSTQFHQTSILFSW